MQSETPDTNILVWLPSPMGDAILCTPALRAIREHFKSSTICFLASSLVRETLSPSAFNDQWIDIDAKNPLTVAAQLKRHGFSHAVLFKNSFASALAVFLAGIPARIGYAREKRGFLLTGKLRAARLPDGRFKPQSMIDYYLAISGLLGAEAVDRSLGLDVEPKATEDLKSKVPELTDARGPIVVIVPGGAFGPSKHWPDVSFARTADWLITNCNATVIISVAPQRTEMQIAENICDSSRHGLVNLAERSLSIGGLKALFSASDLVISNDTGPRHIAVALGRKVVTLFGPNDPAWTDTKYEHEIQIVGNVPCAPCNRPNCSQSQHLCMQMITVETVCEASKQLLEGDRKHATIMTQQQFVETSASFFMDPDHKSGLTRLGLDSIDSVFSFDAATNLGKENLARFRSRVQFEMDAPQPPGTNTVFLKRYSRPPVLAQFKNWLSARGRRSCALIEFAAASQLTAFGINTPKTICYGEQWGSLFEKRSFIITQRIPRAASLERRLPDCFTGPPAAENLKLRRDFITRLAAFARKFHETNYRHRDLYFAHIFCDDDGRFHLIDLARAFEPIFLSRRFQIKDIAQIHYSAPGRYFSKTDRLRFYLSYAGRDTLASQNKIFIRKVVNKARRMARHDKKHGREAPFES